MWSWTRVAALAGMAALVTAGVAACGQQRGARPSAAQATGGPAGAVHAVQAAYAATMKARTATFQLVETVQAKSASGSHQGGTVTGSGRVDFAANSFAESTNTIRVVNGAAGTEYIRVSAAGAGRSQATRRG